MEVPHFDIGSDSGSDSSGGDSREPHGEPSPKAVQAGLSREPPGASTSPCGRELGHALVGEAQRLFASGSGLLHSAYSRYVDGIGLLLQALQDDDEDSEAERYSLYQYLQELEVVRGRIMLVRGR